MGSLNRAQTSYSAAAARSTSIANSTPTISPSLTNPGGGSLNPPISAEAAAGAVINGSDWSRHSAQSNANLSRTSTPANSSQGNIAPGQMQRAVSVPINGPINRPSSSGGMQQLPNQTASGGLARQMSAPPTRPSSASSSSSSNLKSVDELQKQILENIKMQQQLLIGMKRNSGVDAAPSSHGSANSSNAGGFNALAGGNGNANIYAGNMVRTMGSGSSVGLSPAMPNPAMSSSSTTNSSNCTNNPALLGSRGGGALTLGGLGAGRSASAGAQSQQALLLRQQLQQRQQTLMQASAGRNSSASSTSKATGLSNLFHNKSTSMQQQAFLMQQQANANQQNLNRNNVSMQQQAFLMQQANNNNFMVRNQTNLPNQTNHQVNNNFNSASSGINNAVAAQERLLQQQREQIQAQQLRLMQMRQQASQTKKSNSVASIDLNGYGGQQMQNMTQQQQMQRQQPIQQPQQMQQQGSSQTTGSRRRSSANMKGLDFSGLDEGETFTPEEFNW